MMHPIVVGLKPTILFLISILRQDTPHSKVLGLQLRVFETSATHFFGVGPLGIGPRNSLALSIGFAGLSVRHLSLLVRDLLPQARRLF